MHGQDLGALRGAIAASDPGWLAAAVGCVLLFLVCEASALHLLLNSFGMGIGPSASFAAACIGFFFSAITPSATGGQPMMVYYLRKRDSIPVSVSSVALLVMALSYQLNHALCGLAATIAVPGILGRCLGSWQFLFWLGLAVTAGWSGFLVLLIFHPSVARGIAVWFLTVLEELRILKNREKLQMELEVSMDMYRDAAAHLRRTPAVMAGAFLLMLGRRFALLSVTYCVYRAMGLGGTGWLSVVAMQLTISLSADLLPLPGGMGATEALFARVYGALFGTLVVPGMILSRGIGHYGQLLLSAAVTLLAFALLNRRPRPEP